MSELYDVVARDQITHEVRRVIERGQTQEEVTKIIFQLNVSKPEDAEYYTAVPER